MRRERTEQRSFLIFAALILAATQLLAEGRWVTLREVLEPRQEVAVAATGGKIYLMGGLRAGGTSASVEVYDPATGRWSFVAPMPEPLHHPTALAHAGKIYVLGGYRSLAFDPTDSAYRYDPATDRWTAIARMPLRRGAAAGAVIGERLYLVGGAGPVTGQLAAYDPAADRWTVLASMPTPRDHLAADVIAGKLYAVGGRAAGNLTLRTNEEYDPATNSWRARAPMPTGRSGIAAAAVGDRLYVFGGEGNAARPGGVFVENESYDPSRDQWRREPDMPSPRHGIAAGVVGGTIYLPAGANLQGFGTTGIHDAFTPEDTTLIHSWALPAARFLGGNGAFWSSEVTVANLGESEATVSLSLRDQERRFSLPPNGSLRFPDVLGMLFGRGIDSGVLLLRSGSQRIASTSSTSTAATGGGSYGDSVRGFAAGEWIAPGRSRSLIGLREDAQFRSNLFLMNPGSVAVLAQLVAFDASGGRIGSGSHEVAPLGSLSVPQVLRSLSVAPGLAGVTLQISTATPGGLIHAIGSIVDNGTNDPRSVTPQ